MNSSQQSEQAVVLAASEDAELQALADQLGLRRVESVQHSDSVWYLHSSEGRLMLSHNKKKHLQNISADLNPGSPRFASAAKVAHELLIKAIGGLAPPQYHIADATAGLGTDSLLLAQAGHRVSMLERSPVVAALLANALQRCSDSSLALTLLQGDACDLLAEMVAGQQPDIVYLDPMFPAAKGKAMARKELQALKELLPPALNEDKLLQAALDCAGYRVVVKRPLKAAPLAERKPGFCYSGKLIRYDCYALRKLP